MSTALDRFRRRKEFSIMELSKMSARDVYMLVSNTKNPDTLRNISSLKEFQNYTILQQIMNSPYTPMDILVSVLTNLLNEDSYSSVHVAGAYHHKRIPEEFFRIIFVGKTIKRVTGEEHIICHPDCPVDILVKVSRWKNLYNIFYKYIANPNVPSSVLRRLYDGGQYHSWIEDIVEHPNFPPEMKLRHDLEQ